MRSLFNKSKSLSPWGKTTFAIGVAGTAYTLSRLDFSYDKNEGLSFEFDDTELRSMGNSFSNRARNYGFFSSAWESYLEKYLMVYEAVTFTDNSQPSKTGAKILFRGEANYSREGDEIVLDHLSKSAIKYGRYPTLCALRATPWGERFFNLPPTVGGMIVHGDNENIPALWTSGGTSLTGSLPHAIHYVGNDGILILAAPIKYVCVGEYHSVCQPSGEKNFHEWEYFTPGLDSKSIMAVVKIQKGKPTQTLVNDDFFKVHDKIVIDNQLKTFLSKLDPVQPGCEELISKLTTQAVESKTSFAAEYEALESVDVYDEYLRTFTRFVNIYKENIANKGYLTQFFLGRSLGDFVMNKIPSINQVIECRYKDTCDPDKMEKLYQALRDIGVPESVLQKKVVIAKQPTLFSAA